MRQEPVKCFFIYSAKPLDLAETIENAMLGIKRQESSSFEVVGWRELSSTGEPILGQVRDAIDRADLIVCDITSLSWNVLFELGYAIGRNKRVWTTIRNSDEDAKRRSKQIPLLQNLAYCYYENSDELVSSFLVHKPHEEGNSIYRDLLKLSATSSDDEHKLFYMQAAVNTDASRQLSRRIEQAKLPSIVDDPSEVLSNTLEWYIQNIYSAFAIVCHFSSAVGGTEKAQIQDAKYATMLGVACAFDKQILAIAHAPYLPPADFRDFLRVHETARECAAIADQWLADIVERYRTSRANVQRTRSDIKREVTLTKLNLGQYVAENEAEELSSYFIVTAPFNDALKASQHMIFVGRKGTGKTANLLQLAEQLNSDKRNFVCIIKPVDYEFEGLVHLLTQSANKISQGYLAESLWKFLIYTELARSLYRAYKERPAHASPSPDEQQFLSYVERHQGLILEEFAERLESAIEELCQVELSEHIREQRAKVSEILHSQVLNDLRDFLGRLLREKAKVVILIDNLDKAWRKRENIDLLSDFLFGLLSASQVISDDFRTPRVNSRVNWQSVNLSLIVFLRSDIFSYLMNHARESDKIAYQRLDWTDPRMLQRVIAERFAQDGNGGPRGEEIWEEYFESPIDGQPVQDYICNRIIPRPRDIIYFCKDALAHAVNHRHSRIMDIDIKMAVSSYSEHAFKALLAETEVQVREIEAALYEFVDQSSILSAEIIYGFFRNAGIAENRFEEVIDLLIEHTFLGIETAPDEFAYVYEQNRMPVLRKLAARTMEQTGIRKFSINPPFHSFLAVRNT